MASYFFIIFLLTILLTRLFLFLHPTASPNIGRFRLHHYMYGIVGVLIGLAMHSLSVYAIGMGLFIDELTYLLIRGKDHVDNYSKLSLLGTLFFIIIVFLLKDYLITPFN